MPKLLYICLWCPYYRQWVQATPWIYFENAATISKSVSTSKQQD